jgi:hypothetical protein
VDIFIISSGSLELADNFLSVVKNSVGQDRGKTSKHDTIGESKKDGETSRTVFGICYLIQGVFGGKDHAIVPNFTSGSEQRGGDNGESLGIPDIGIVKNWDEDPCDDSETNYNNQNAM